MKITIKGLDVLSREKQEEILLRILSWRGTNLGWINSQLRFREIEGRTKIYKAFQDPCFYNRDNPNPPPGQNLYEMSTAQQEARIRYVKDILDQSNLNDWIQDYTRITEITKVARMLAPSMNNRIELEIELVYALD